MTEVVILDGKLINIGPWDECITITYEAQNPYQGQGDAPEDWNFEILEVRTIHNPLPEGATVEDRDIVESEKGRLLLKEDYQSLREDAYPPIKDQLDATWKGGEEAEAMKQFILSIKEKYPKPDEK